MPFKIIFGTQAVKRQKDSLRAIITMLTNVVIFDSAFNGLVTVCGRIKYDMNNTYTILTNRVCRAFKSNNK